MNEYGFTDLAALIPVPPENPIRLPDDASWPTVSRDEWVRELPVTAKLAHPSGRFGSCVRWMRTATR